MIDVTVITPSLPDRAAYRSHAIASVVWQTEQPKHHLIAIDYQLEGPYRIINRLMQTVTTEWFCILPDDDYWREDHLKRLHDLSDGVQMVYSFGKFIGKGAERKNETSYVGPFDLERWRKGGKDTGLRGAHFLMKTHTFQLMGGFNATDLKPDHDFLCRFMDRSPQVVSTPAHTWYYTLHDKSLSAAITRFYADEEVGDLYYMEGLL